VDNPDFLIVGGGSAGATLASRLSEDPATRVLLIEAGPDTPPDAVPADIADTFPSSSINPSYFWPGLHAIRRTGEAPRPFPQARVMGGGSSVMGLWALRGMPSDYDAWAEAGAQGWAWRDVLTYFRRLEDDADRDQSQSKPGPYPIRRIPPQDWPGFVTAIERVAAGRGFRGIADINEAPGDGFFPMPLSQDADTRSSSPKCYLTREVRRRANLAIMADTRVTALRIEGGSVRGVTVERAGETKTIAARNVVLSAGAIHSPAILLRAGIGPAEELKAMGVAPAIDRPGVGRNLQNHPYLHFALTLPPKSRLAPHLRRFAVAGIRASSQKPDCPPSDLLNFMIGRVSPRAFGPDFAMVGAALYAPFSRGAVSLVSPDPGTPPRIEFRLLDDPRDAPRMLHAARLAEALIFDPAVAATFSEAFLLPPVMSLNQFNRPGLAGALLGVAAKSVLNAPGPLRRRLIARAIRPGRWIGDKRQRLPLSDDELLAAVAPMAHVSCTCMIGRPDDRMAVVDSACRVYGIGNLRVVDASVMPRVTSANTNLPTLMIAERAADLIRGRA